MTVQQIKYVIINSLIALFPNKKSLNKISESDTGEFLYDGKSLTKELEELHQTEIDKANTILDSINKVSV